MNLTAFQTLLDERAAIRRALRAVAPLSMERLRELDDRLAQLQTLIDAALAEAAKEESES